MKKMPLLLFALYMSLSISFQGCGDDEPTGPDDEENQVTVNEPTNDYIVTALIFKSGFFGCTFIIVDKNGPVTDAIVKINGLKLTGQNGGLYFDSLSVVGYGLGNSYDLSVEIGGNEIASGTAIMPSQPTITNLADSVQHEVNQPITVEWDEPTNASSVQLTLSRPFPSEDFATEFLGITPTSYTLPGSLFAVDGNYSLTAAAYYGLNPGLNEDSTKGYNIKGAAGVFIAINSTEQTVITVGNSGGGSLIKKNQRLYGILENASFMSEYWIARLREKLLE
ncbi:MAG: hypothetical protein IIA58_06340 [Candidatus Marinimicrobia bacterium]|nr:hypothetical protein [Candidatus Neomarinimicrobiota bacterium]